MIPEELRPDYEELIIGHTDEEYRLVKAADKICAYLKCVEELKTGNLEFKQAKASILAEIERMNIPAVGYFMEKFEPSFGLTLDELN